MPPVFGPWSPSRRRLWSWLVASGSTCVPSPMHDEARFLALEELLDHDARAGVAQLVARRASRRSRRAPRPRVAATTTPLPAARPSALTTIGAPRCVDVGLRSRGVGERRVRAVGMPWRTMKLLAKSFELSSCAAARVGPKIRRPASRKASTTPAASGASGPTTVRSIVFLLRERDELGDRRDRRRSRRRPRSPCRRCRARRTPSARAGSARASRRARARGRPRR